MDSYSKELIQKANKVETLIDTVFNILGRVIKVVYRHQQSVIYFYDLLTGECVDSIPNTMVEVISSNRIDKSLTGGKRKTVEEVSAKLEEIANKGSSPDKRFDPESVKVKTKQLTQKERLEKWNNTVVPNQSSKWKFVEGEKTPPDLRNHCVVCDVPVDFVNASYGRAMIGWFPKYVEELILTESGDTIPNIKKVMIPLLKTGDVCSSCLSIIGNQTYTKDGDEFPKWRPMDRPVATSKEGARTVPASMVGVRASRQDDEARPRARDGNNKPIPVKTFVTFTDRKTGEEERWLVPNEEVKPEPVDPQGFNAYGLNRKGGRKSYV